MSENPIFSYTNRDYETARQESISKIPHMSKGDWTDTNSTDPGIIILDHVHALVDMMQFYMDHNALESYISTAKERKNIFSLAKQLGYKISSAKGSEVYVQFSTTKSYDSPYTIPKNTVVHSYGSSDRIQFLTTEDLVIYQGIIKGTVLCRQGVLVEIPYTGTGMSSTMGGLNVEDQYVILSTLGIDTDTIEVLDSSGYNWKQVENVYFSSPGAREFSTELLYDGTVKVLFGNGDRGYAPQEYDNLTIRYIYSMGSKGKVAANSIDTIGGNPKIYTEKGVPVTDLSVINLENSSGGSDPEDSELIRELAPAIIKTQDRAVTLKDYEVLARKVSGVRDAKAYDKKNAPADMNLQYYEVLILVLPEDFTTSDILKNNVYQYLSKKSIPPVVITVISAKEHMVDIDVRVVATSEYTDEHIKSEIIKSLKSYFDKLSAAVGSSVNPNALISLISKVDGVLYVDSIVPENTVILNPQEIATLGSVNITVLRRGN